MTWRAVVGVRECLEANGQKKMLEKCIWCPGMLLKRTFGRIIRLCQFGHRKTSPSDNQQVISYFHVYIMCSH
jgi:hypothetical protein